MLDIVGGLLNNFQTWRIITPEIFPDGPLYYDQLHGKSGSVSLSQPNKNFWSSELIDFFPRHNYILEYFRRSKFRKVCPTMLQIALIIDYIPLFFI